MAMYGLIGNPVAQSLSPVLHGLIGTETGRKILYGLFPVERENAAGIVTAAKTLGLSGFNVTSPYKTCVATQLDALSDEVREIGAVNTVKIEAGGRAVGYNTDGPGLVDALLYEGIEIANRRFLLCGTGGAAQAVAYALRQNDAAEILFASRDFSKGIDYRNIAALPRMDVIVNCTPLGMAGHGGSASPVSTEAFAGFSTAVDLIYSPAETPFLRQAREAGLKTVNGLGMLVFQGIRAFEIWTGAVPRKSAIGRIVEKLACISD